MICSSVRYITWERIHNQWRYILDTLSHLCFNVVEGLGQARKLLPRDLMQHLVNCTLVCSDL